ncbi:MAG: hypothetical protein QM765_44550 [Myxococcales bacterium]
MTVLGLLLSLFVLTGATCLDNLTQNGGTSNNNQKTTPPSVTVYSPTANMTIAAGTWVQISWHLFDPSNAAQVTVFYDVNRNAGNGFTNLTVLTNSALGRRISTTGIPRACPTASTTSASRLTTVPTRPSPRTRSAR